MFVFEEAKSSHLWKPLDLQYVVLVAPTLLPTQVARNPSHGNMASKNFPCYNLSLQPSCDVNNFLSPFIPDTEFKGGKVKICPSYIPSLAKSKNEEYVIATAALLNVYAYPTSIFMTTNGTAQPYATHKVPQSWNTSHSECSCSPSKVFFFQQ